MERVLFGQPAAEAIVAEAERIQAKRVFVLAGGTLNRQTDEVRKLAEALGSDLRAFPITCPHTRRSSAVVACANAAREDGYELLVTFGGSVTGDESSHIWSTISATRMDWSRFAPWSRTASGISLILPHHSAADGCTDHAFSW